MTPQIYDCESTDLKPKIKHSNLKSAIRPVPHCDEIPAPNSPTESEALQNPNMKQLQVTKRTTRKK